MYIWGVPAPTVHRFVRDWPERGEDSQDMKIGLIVELFFTSSVRWHPGFTVQWLGKKKKLNLKVFTLGPNATNGQCKEVVQKQKK